MSFTLEAMRGPLEAFGYDTVGELAVFKIFSIGKVKKDKRSMQNAHEHGETLAQARQGEVLQEAENHLTTKKIPLADPLKDHIVIQELPDTAHRFLI